MPIFYFHLHECGTVISDDEGRAFAEVSVAHAIAIQDAREVMCAEVKEGRLCLSCCIVIADADGVEVDRVQFAEALTVTGASDSR